MDLIVTPKSVYPSTNYIHVIVKIKMIWLAITSIIIFLAVNNHAKTAIIMYIIIFLEIKYKKGI